MTLCSPTNFRSLSLAFLAAWSFGPASLQADKRVTVRVEARPGYVEARTDQNGDNITQSYVFMQGEFLPGPIKDRSMESMEMIEVAHTLAPYLAEQEFIPTADTGTADLVIAVHWGMTTSLRHNQDYVMFQMEQARDRQIEAQEFYNSYYVDSEGNDIPQGDFAQELLRSAAADAAAAPDYDWATRVSARSEREISSRPVASVLGFDDVLNTDAKRAFMGEDARTLSAYLGEERYFVVLMAYDLKNREDGESPNRVWVARLSMPSNGTNFPDALKRMGEAASDLVGSDHPDLQIKRSPTNLPEGEVEIGDAIVVEDP